MTASREMFTDELVEAMENLHLYPRLIAERAAKEAVAAERARIAEAVRGLFGQFHPMAAIEDEPTRHDVVSRKAVLTLMDACLPDGIK
jgi:hypothetical protein